ncbi:MAG: hypothetical protein MUO62_05330, partial [Anaerolineales bacterium]|nr:hypothetical protein [Anaerolineales bacterium]
MPISILLTKLYISSPRPEVVSRPHLIERLNAGLVRQLSLISSPAGFGKTTLLQEWVSAANVGSKPQGASWVGALDMSSSHMNGSAPFTSLIPMGLKMAEKSPWKK